MIVALTFSYPKRDLGDGYSCTRYNTGGTWVLYHNSNPRQALWEAYSVGELRSWIVG